MSSHPTGLKCIDGKMGGLTCLARHLSEQKGINTHVTFERGGSCTNKKSLSVCSEQRNYALERMCVPVALRTQSLPNLSRNKVSPGG
jgi:hypothetical protein